MSQRHGAGTISTDSRDRAASPVGAHADLPQEAYLADDDDAMASPGGKFHPGRVSETGKTSPLWHLEAVPILHWHSDTFDLSENVELVASSHLHEHPACCQSHANLSPPSAIRAGSMTRQAARFCHSAMAAERRAL